MAMNTSGDFTLTLDGTAVTSDWSGSVVELTVENSIHMPDLCTIRIEDEDWKYVSDASVCLGTLVEVKGRLLDETASKSLFIGEITSIDFDCHERDTPILVIRCLDKRHRLHRGRFCQTFVQKKDSEIFSDIVTAAELTADTDATTEVHDWVIQHNQTHWEFLCERARLSGRRIYLTGEKTLCFKTPTDSSDTPIDLTWGDNLFSFNPQVSASPTADQVTVRSWDPKTKQPIISTKSDSARLPTAAAAASAASDAKQAFGSRVFTVVDCPVASQGIADALAGSLLEEIGGAYLTAEGSCVGNSALKPLQRVKLCGFVEKFCGIYEVTATTHTFTRDSGYVTTFSVTSRRADTLFACLESGARRPAVTSRLQMVVGIVTDLEDPDGQGRVKVKYPWLSDDETSFWVRQTSPMAGGTRGFQFLPEIDDEVLVAFEHGDIHRPFIIGSLWNGVDAPIDVTSKAVVEKKVVRRTIKSRIGHTILFDDTDEKGLVSLVTKGEHQAVLSDVDENVTLKSKSGHTVLLDDKNKKIVIVDSTAKNSITLDASSNALQLVCDGDFSISAKGKVAIKGDGGVTVTTQAALDLKGDQGLTANSSGVMTLKGQLIKLN